MNSRRRQFLEHYLERSPSSDQIKKSAASSDLSLFHGEGTAASVVARTDLNGYSKWSREKSIADRVELLDEFFSVVAKEIYKHNAVYYRDEGDCVVTIFSDYFGNGSVANILAFCKAVTNKYYSKGEITAKTTVGFGDLAFFQKTHEVASGDWSAEGEPFVVAARLENAVDSAQRIYFEEATYDAVFSNIGPVANKGQYYYWGTERESIQVPGLGLPGGWMRVAYLEYKPGGRIQQ